ncbi:hypothetical protein Tco_0319059 [Tanacetum coccineum]
MAEEQPIMYAPQWNNMNVDNVLDKNYSSTKQVNSIQQLLAYCLITRTEFDIGEIIYSDLVTKLLNNSRIKYFSHPRFIPCALQVLLGYDYTQDIKALRLQSYSLKIGKSPCPKRHLKKPRKHHPQPTEGSKQSYLVFSGTIPDLQDPERNIQLAGTGLPSTLDEGTHKSQTLLECKTTNPKDSRGNNQPADKGLPSMASNEGTAKTTPHPEGPLRDKDSGGNKTLADMEPIHLTVDDPLGRC